MFCSVVVFASVHERGRVAWRSSAGRGRAGVCRAAFAIHARSWCAVLAIYAPGCTVGHVCGTVPTLVPCNHQVSPCVLGFAGRVHAAAAAAPRHPRGGARNAPRQRDGGQNEAHGMHAGLAPCRAGLRYGCTPRRSATRGREGGGCAFGGWASRHRGLVSCAARRRHNVGHVMGNGCGMVCYGSRVINRGKFLGGNNMVLSFSFLRCKFVLFLLLEDTTLSRHANAKSFFFGTILQLKHESHYWHPPAGHRKRP